MKIGILTLPLHNNYGGILQAYALMAHLNRSGHEVYLIDYNPNKPLSKWKQPLALAKRIIFKYALRKNIVVLKERKVRIDNQYIQEFINKYIQPKTVKMYGPDALGQLNSYKFDACIVGSDQVWRELYNGKFITNYFFDFIVDDKVKKISYAASFGVDTWDYDHALTGALKSLAAKFTALSVRESSGVQLCKQFLGVDAELVLDPTMLLQRSDYEKLLNTKSNSSNTLLLYILDETEQKRAVIEKVASIQNYNKLAIGHSEEDEPNPPIQKWLEGFSNANFMITDSFHGCVFSIIFNVPFLVIGNEGRGLARFRSLLSLFNLENRLVTSDTNIQSAALNPINWDSVNAILRDQKMKSMAFLDDSLKN